MKIKLHSTLAAAVLAVLSLPAMFAQVPAGAPKGTTAMCNDGSYWTGAARTGACSGHKGLKTWYSGAASASPSASASPAMMMAAKPAAKPTVAPGGGKDKVWFNSSSNVYHCYGSRYYGTTKDGVYMAEADAKKKGAKPASGKPCS